MSATPNELRVLTVRQPHASLIALGAKRIETRSWATNYRGLVAIHAGKAMPCRLRETLTMGKWAVERDSRSGLLLRAPSLSWPYRLPRSAVVAVCELYDCRPVEDIARSECRDEAVLGDYSPGRYGWFLRNVLPIKAPVPACGRLGLWHPDAELRAEIEGAFPLGVAS